MFHVSNNSVIDSIILLHWYSTSSKISDRPSLYEIHHHRVQTSFCNVGQRYYNYYVCRGTVVMYCLTSIPYLYVVMLVLLLKLYGDNLKLNVTCDFVAL